MYMFICVKTVRWAIFKLRGAMKIRGKLVRLN